MKQKRQRLARIGTEAPRFRRTFLINLTKKRERERGGRPQYIASRIRFVGGRHSRVTRPSRDPVDSSRASRRHDRTPEVRTTDAPNDAPPGRRRGPQPGDRGGRPPPSWRSTTIPPPRSVWTLSHPPRVHGSPQTKNSHRPQWLSGL